MKALELKVYPKRGEGERLAYALPHVILHAISVDWRSKKKRLTDAELAAEMFSAVFHEDECEVRARKLGEGHPAFNHWLNANHEYARQAVIVERFATLPHYDEPTP